MVNDKGWAVGLVSCLRPSFKYANEPSLVLSSEDTEDNDPAIEPTATTLPNRRSFKRPISTFLG